MKKLDIFLLFSKYYNSNTGYNAHGRDGPMVSIKYDKCQEYKNGFSILLKS